MSWGLRAQIRGGTRRPCLPTGSMRSRFASTLLASAALAGLSASAGAATVTWTSTSSGPWGENQRWSSNPSLPAVGDDVVIDVANQNLLVTIKTSVFSVKSVTSNEGLF